MYAKVLALHSFTRWLVVASLLIAMFLAYRGWLRRKSFTKFDNRIRHITATIAHIQLFLGVWLYFISPLISYFLHNYKIAVKERSIRFFGMEHSAMMLVAIVMITIGSASAKRKTTSEQKFKTMAIWFTIAFLLILINIPWKFSPMASRPYLRFF
ncbi:MAG: hypothetical protein M3R72_01880 [Bacteroidota bacterium]|nr:hypothetical protein [Bacteroidota bacterium]